MSGLSAAEALGSAACRWKPQFPGNYCYIAIGSVDTEEIHFSFSNSVIGQNSSIYFTMTITFC